MRSLVRILGLALLLIYSAGSAEAQPLPTSQPAPAPPTQPESQPQSQPLARESTPATSVAETLKKAIGLYQDSEFEEALQLLRQLRTNVGRQKSREAEQTLSYLGCVLVAMGKRSQALSAFEAALDIQPELKLPSSSPKILEIFSQAKQRYRAKIKALDHDPPRMTHKPVLKANYGKELRVIVQASDLTGIKRIALNFRTVGNRGFSSVNMERNKDGNYLATIPLRAVVRPGVEYYLAAWDNVGNGPGLKGSPGLPIRCKVLGGPVANQPLQPQDNAWYKKWWVWAIVAGAVTTAGGVAGLVYGTRSKTAELEISLPPNMMPNSSGTN
jgi:tetratricopeptide (TPR) repeat protein